MKVLSNFVCLFPTSFASFQLKQKLSNFRLSNLNVSNFPFFSNCPFQLHVSRTNLCIKLKAQRNRQVLTWKISWTKDLRIASKCHWIFWKRFWQRNYSNNIVIAGVEWFRWHFCDWTKSGFHWLPDNPETPRHPGYSGYYDNQGHSIALMSFSWWGINCHVSMSVTNCHNSQWLSVS